MNTVEGFSGYTGQDVNFMEDYVKARAAAANEAYKQYKASGTTTGKYGALPTAWDRDLPWISQLAQERENLIGNPSALSQGDQQLKWMAQSSTAAQKEYDRLKALYQGKDNYRYTQSVQELMDWEQKRGEFFANNPLAFDESTGQVLAGGRPAFEAMQEAGVFTPPSAQYEQAPIEYFVGRFDSFMDMQADNIRGHSSAPVAKIRENIKYLLEQSGDQYDEGDLEELVRYYSMKYGVKVPSESGGQGAGTGYNATITYDPVRPGPYLSAMGGIDGWSQEDFKNGKVESVVFTPDSKDRKPKAHKVSFKDENGRMNSVFFEPERIFKTPKGYMVYGHETLKNPMEAALKDYATRTYILDEDNMTQFLNTFMPEDENGNPVSIDSFFKQEAEFDNI